MLNNILIITNDTSDADILKAALASADEGAFTIEWVKKLSAALERLRQAGIDAILVDLELPDSQGIATFDQLFALVPHIPIVTLSQEEAEAVAIEAVERGSQGYLSKGYFKSTLVPQSLRNIIQRKAVEESLYKERVRAEIALNSISDAVLCTDLSGNIDYLNVAAEKLTGWLREEANGQPVCAVFNLINSVTRKKDQNPVEVVLQQNIPRGLNANTLLIRRDKTEIAIEDSISPIHNRQGKLTGAVIVFHDVSATQAMTLKMTHLAQHDFLTNLPNRLLLNDRIEQAITLAKRRKTQIAILFLDLDNFKHINDSLGHAAGDLLLQSVTACLNRCVRGSDTVSRQGGDEFVILLDEGKTGEEAALTADKILAELCLPHEVGNSQLHISASIGISIFPIDGENAETLIKNADTAMYAAKEKGRNNYQFFRQTMNARAIERQLIEANLRIALERQEFILHYQPKISLHSGLITGAEALIRWQHHEWGMLMPERFIAIAEDCGLIVPMGRWVLREACRQFKQWLDDGVLPGTIAINISALEFRHRNFVEGIKKILTDTGLEARYLQLEITESVLMHDAEASIEVLLALKKIGVHVAADDFGTGYSSLSYLQKFPIDILKIDQSFVCELSAGSHSSFIVNAIISMAKSLQLKVVAEGIETRQQLNLLQKQRCDEGQGHIFSMPLSAENFQALVSPLLLH